MSKENLRLPLAIVLAGLLIAIAIFLSNQAPKDNSATETKKTEAGFYKIKPISASEHIIGNPNAEAVFVEFSDTECPFCKRFHTTMNQLVADYSKDGKLAWVYRHLPIDGLHSKSRKEAAAAECAGVLGGESTFWQYLNTIYEITPSNDGLDPSLLSKVATDLKLDATAFGKCLNSPEAASKVETYYQDGLVASSGLPGTPQSVVFLKKPLTESAENTINLAFSRIRASIEISPDRKVVNISGALPYEALKLFIDTVTTK